MSKPVAVRPRRKCRTALRSFVLVLACVAPDARADTVPAASPSTRSRAVVVDAADPVGTTRVDGEGPTRTSRTRVPDDFPLPTLLGVPWRLDIEWTLGRDGTDRVLVDGRGAVTRFAPRRRLADGTWRWMAPDGALLDGGAGRYRLREADGRLVEFVGSRPARATAPDGGTERWKYADGRLTFHADASGRVRRLRRDADGAVIGVVGSDGTELRYRPESAGRRRSTDTGGTGAGDGTSWLDRCPVDGRCDPATAPPPGAFAAGPSIPGASTLDVRPAHCGSHFDEPSATARGTAIERGLAGAGPHADRHPTSRNFPLVDLVGAGELVVVRSRDLAGPTYTDPVRPALFDRLMRDGREVRTGLIEPLARGGAVAVTPEAGDPGVARVDAVPGRTVVIELVVRHGTANPDQVRQIERARVELMRRHDIELRVVEIP